jgi:hypothetical protein
MPRTKPQPKEKEMEITVTRKIKLLEKTCPVCGKIFWGPKLRVYCTGRGGVCANRANYLKHAEERRTERREVYRQKTQSRRGK